MSASMFKPTDPWFWCEQAEAYFQINTLDDRCRICQRPFSVHTEKPPAALDIYAVRERNEEMAGRISEFRKRLLGARDLIEALQKTYGLQTGGEQYPNGMCWTREKG